MSRFRISGRFLNGPTRFTLPVTGLIPGFVYTLGLAWRLEPSLGQGAKWDSMINSPIGNTCNGCVLGGGVGRVAFIEKGN